MSIIALYAVEIKEMDLQLIIPEDNTLNAFKVCWPMVDKFKKRHGRHPGNGDVYVLTSTRDKLIMTAEEFMVTGKDRGFLIRGKKKKATVDSFLIE